MTILDTYIARTMTSELTITSTRTSRTTNETLTAIERGALAQNPAAVYLASPPIPNLHQSGRIGCLGTQTVTLRLCCGGSIGPSR